VNPAVSEETNTIGSTQLERLPSKEIPDSEDEDANSQREFGVRHGIESFCSRHSVNHRPTNASENVHKGGKSSSVETKSEPGDRHTS